MFVISLYRLLWCFCSSLCQSWNSFYHTAACPIVAIHSVLSHQLHQMSFHYSREIKYAKVSAYCMISLHVAMKHDCYMATGRARVRSGRKLQTSWAAVNSGPEGKIRLNYCSPNVNNRSVAKFSPSTARLPLFGIRLFC